MIRNEDRVVDGQRWLVRQAVSEQAALNEIGMARVTGSIGSKSVSDKTLVGGDVTVTAEVHRYCSTCGGDKLVEVYGACHDR